MNRTPLINILDSVTVTASPQPDNVTLAKGHVLEDVHNCPICSRPMTLLTVSRRSDPIKSWVCLEDRVSLPMKDE